MGPYLLRRKAYDNYRSAVQGPPESLERWMQSSIPNNPMFMFWYITLDLKLLMYRFIRSLREGDFTWYMMIPCDGPHKLCSLSTSACTGYGPVASDTLRIIYGIY